MIKINSVYKTVQFISLIMDRSFDYEKDILLL